MEWMKDFAVPMVVAFCTCIGFVLKNAIPSKKINKWIPLILGAIGVGFNTWIAGTITPEIATCGLLSGILSTGLYETFKNMIVNK